VLSERIVVGREEANEASLLLWLIGRMKDIYMREVARESARCSLYSLVFLKGRKLQSQHLKSNKKKLEKNFLLFCFCCFVIRLHFFFLNRSTHLKNDQENWWWRYLEESRNC
jgi:uncharacterized membrane protein YbjE (DUF340 family)